MSYIFHIVIGMVVIVIQTTLVQHTGLLLGLYDLILVQIIYLGLYRPTREGLIIVFIFGVVMDGLTGGTYGLYLTTYIWLFAGIRWALTFFRLSNTLITPFVVVFGVLLENLVHLIGTVSLSSSLMFQLSASFGILIFQIIWVLFTGPLFLLLLKKAYHHLTSWQRRIWMTGTTLG